MQTYFEWHGVHTWSRICEAIDFQTLVTHNHTIICGSLGEGLTYSPCANHARAYCHKKDCVQVGSPTDIMTVHSFTFLFTMSVQLFNWWFQFSYPLIYRQKCFCKSCDRFTLITSAKISNLYIVAENLNFNNMHFLLVINHSLLPPLHVLDPLRTVVHLIQVLQLSILDRMLVAADCPTQER